MIKHNIARPAVNQRTGVEIFNTANPERLSILHSLGAGELRFSARMARCRSLLRAVEMPIIAVALDGDSPGFADCMFERGDALLLRGGRSGHVKNLFFHAGPVPLVY